MYLEFFGLKEHPFQLTPDSHFLYLSDSHSRAKAYMEYTVWKRDGFVVITGEIGAGKTTLIHKLLSEIKETVKTIRIFQTQLDEVEFLQAMLVDLGYEPSQLSSTNKVELLNILNHALIEHYSQGKHVVLIVDEAQNLSPKVLEEIRLLSGVEPDKEKILNVILVGQPELNDTLNRPGMEQLVQRIRLRFHVGALTPLEAEEYITHRMHIAGAVDDIIFVPETFPIIYEFTGGIPRKINILCDTALICAFADSLRKVSPEVVMEAVEELQWKPARKTNNTSQGGGEADRPPGDQEPWSRAMQAPRFVGGDDQWGNMFSLALSMLTDVTRRMQSIEENLRRLDHPPPPERNVGRKDDEVLADRPCKSMDVNSVVKDFEAPQVVKK